MRVALLDQPDSVYSRKVETALRAAGHEPHRVGPSTVPTLEALLRRRGFMLGLTHVPHAARELLRGEFELAHAFSAPDAAAALAWRRVHGRPVVFTCTETLDRATVADARLRLATLARAVESTDALVASSEAVRASIERWFACRPPVIAPTDVGAHERLYRELLAKRPS